MRAILDPLYASVACVPSRTKRTGLNSKNSLTPRENPSVAKGPRGKREGRRRADKGGERTQRDTKWGIRIKIVPSIGARVPVGPFYSS